MVTASSFGSAAKAEATERTMQPASAGAASMDLPARIFFVVILFNNLAGNAKPGFIPIEKASAFSQSGGMNFFAQPAQGATLERGDHAVDSACDARTQVLPLLGERAGVRGKQRSKYQRGWQLTPVLLRTRPESCFWQRRLLARKAGSVELLKFVRPSWLA